MLVECTTRIVKITVGDFETDIFDHKSLVLAVLKDTLI